MAITTSSSLSRAAAHLRVDGISISFTDRRVLTDVSFTVPAGDRTGLIGENGSGKTTLLRVIAGLTRPDGGIVSAIAPGGHAPRIGLLHQEPPFLASMSIAEALASAVAPLRAAADAVDARAHALANTPDDQAAARNYADALETAERVGAWDVDARIDAMMTGLGLGDLPRERETGRLSGGQRSRLALGWLLLSAPEVLLLDEPTNHLDDAATEHLRGVLVSWAGPVLIASHDRAFLDEAVTSLVDLDPAPRLHAVAGPLVGDGEEAGIGITRFTGTYTDYLHARLDARERWERQYREEQGELKRLRAAVGENQSVGHRDWKPRSEVRMAEKYYADRNDKVVSRRVNDAQTRLADLQERQIRKPPPELQFRGLNAAQSTATAQGAWPGPVLAATDVAVAGRLKATSLTVSADEKWLITGPNGSGKSTLLHLLAGDLAPTAGTINRPRGLRVGLLAQEVDLPDPHHRGSERTTREAYEDLVGRKRAEQVPLGTFGLIAGRDEHRPVRVLSVGQQRRLALAVLLADSPDVLLLDEPTNHLSLLLVAQLEAALSNYPGSVVIASHDRWLRRTWTGQSFDLTGT